MRKYRSASASSPNRATPIYGNPKFSIRSRSRHTTRSESSRTHTHTHSYTFTNHFHFVQKSMHMTAHSPYKRDIIGMPFSPASPASQPCLRRRVIGRSKVYAYTYTCRAIITERRRRQRLRLLSLSGCKVVSGRCTPTTRPAGTRAVPFLCPPIPTHARQHTHTRTIIRTHTHPVAETCVLVFAITSPEICQQSRIYARADLEID